MQNLLATVVLVMKLVSGGQHEFTLPGASSETCQQMVDTIDKILVEKRIRHQVYVYCINRSVQATKEIES